MGTDVKAIKYDFIHSAVEELYKNEDEKFLKLINDALFDFSLYTMSRACCMYVCVCEIII